MQLSQFNSISTLLSQAQKPPRNLIGIDPKSFVAINISLPSWPLPLNIPIQLGLTGTLYDGTTVVIPSGLAMWSGKFLDGSVKKPATFTLGANTGVFIGYTSGYVAITASLYGKTSRVTTLIASVVCDSLVINPSPTTTALQGSKIQFQAYINYHVDVKGYPVSYTLPTLVDYLQWSSSNGQVATVNGQGLASVVATNGSTTISASLFRVSVPQESIPATKLTQTLTLVAADPTQVKSIMITPANKYYMTKHTVHFQAVATLFDDSVVPLLNEVKWSSNDRDVIIDPQSGEALVSGVNLGSAIITAQYHALTATTTLNLISAEIKALKIAFDDSLTQTRYKLLEGISTRVRATYTSKPSVWQFSPGNLNQEIIWSSSNPEVASINEYGVITAKNVGSTLITGNLAGHISNSIQLDVAANPVTLIRIMDPSPALKVINESGTTIWYVPQGGSLALNAKIIRRDTPLPQTEVKRIQWASLQPYIASVSDRGVVTMNASSGVATIIATYLNNDGTVGSGQINLNAVWAGAGIVEFSTEIMDGWLTGTSFCVGALISPTQFYTSRDCLSYPYTTPRPNTLIGSTTIYYGQNLAQTITVKHLNWRPLNNNIKDDEIMVVTLDQPLKDVVPFYAPGNCSKQDLSGNFTQYGAITAYQATKDSDFYPGMLDASSYFFKHSITINAAYNIVKNSSPPAYLFALPERFLYANLGMPLVDQNYVVRGVVSGLYVRLYTIPQGQLACSL